ncbi:MAG TPA: peptidoglycan-binding protein, partial [Candidatus Paceibacterota bacterium]|nr:peptidoglycan-binding protein [Candidatus Paceibacterota bacterium]
TWAAADFAYQQALYAAVKTSSSSVSIPVIGPSFGVANGGSGGFKDASSSYYNLSSYEDYGNQHSYSGGSYPSQNIQSNLIAGIYGSDPYYATETGYYTMPDGVQGISELAQGKYYSRLFPEYFNAGIARTFAYDLIDDTNNSVTSSEAHYGLLRGDGTLKPGAVAIQNEISLLQDPGPAFATTTLPYTITNAVGSLHQMLLEKRTGIYYLVLWNEVTSYDVADEVDITNSDINVTLNFPSVMAKVTEYGDITSSTMTTAVNNNIQIMSVSVPDQAIILEIQPALTNNSSGGGGGGTVTSGGGGGGGGGGSAVNYTFPTAVSTSTPGTASSTSIASMTTAQLEALIAQLEAQLQELEAELGNAQSTPVFARNLTLGSFGLDVKALQQYLNAHGFPVNTVPGYAGSLGYETEYFGAKTQEALAALQVNVGITPDVGYFGPITRAYVEGHD